MVVISRVSHRSRLLTGNSYGNIACGALSGLFKKDMKRIIALKRRVFSAGILFLLVGVVVLSVATRQPRLRACTGPWHTYKAGHLIQSEQWQISAPEAAESAEHVVAENKTLLPPDLPHEETLPSALPLTFQKHHFRSPPFLQ